MKATDMSVERIRSFVAFEINEASVLKQFTSVQQALIDTGADLKLVRSENIHVTVRFLGEITPLMVNKVCEEMNSISFKPFEIGLRGVGAFPNPRRVRVIWVGIRSGNEVLMDIFNRLENRLLKLGFAPDRRGFSPHITIARVRSGKNRESLTQQILSRSDYNFGTIKADSLKLMKSVLTPRGPIYSTLHEVKAA